MKILICFLEPLKLVVGKEYSLNVLKEIEVTEDFLGLDVDITECQNKESYDDCTTRHYRNSLLSTCKCLPIDIWTINQVIK